MGGGLLARSHHNTEAALDLFQILKRVGEAIAD
jgi:hypothetical protein